MVSIGTVVDIITEKVRYNNLRDVKRRRDKEKSSEILKYLDGITSSDIKLPTIESRIDEYKVYRVRVDLLHGKAGEPTSVPDDQLPLATFCSMPGAEGVELEVGDQVYVAIVDFDFSKFTIVGLVTNSQAASSGSGASLRRVKELEMDKFGTAKFGKRFMISDGSMAVSWDNLKCLYGFYQPLSTVKWGIENGGTGVSIKGSAEEVDSARKEARDNLGIYSTKILSSSEFSRIQRNNLFERNTIYYIYDEEEN